MQKLFIIIWTCIFLCGCEVKSPSKVPATGHTITSSDIAKLLITQYGVSDTRLVFYDSKYVVMDSNWAENNSMDDFQIYLAFVGMKSAKLESSDCDKYSRAFVENLHRTFRLNTSSESAPAVAVMSYSIAPDPSNQLSRYAHAINIIIVKSEDKHKILFFEPQNGKFVELTPVEKNTISRIIF